MKQACEARYSIGLRGWGRAIDEGRVIWQEHVLMRMLERNIDREEVKDVLRAADVIEDYPNDTPHPSVLLYGKVDDRELHVVAAFDAARQAIHAITAYDPDLFEAGYRRRRDR